MFKMLHKSKEVDDVLPLLKSKEYASNATQLEKVLKNSIVCSVEKLSSKTSEATKEQGFKLYEHSFPNPDEREPIDEIFKRVEKYEKKEDDDGGCFFVHLFKDKHGNVIAYNQGSVVPTLNGQFLFFFWQYG